MGDAKGLFWTCARSRRLVRALCALGLLAAVLPAQATTIPVTTNLDTVADDGACSLREAVIAANTDTASGTSAGECPAGSENDTIVIPPVTIALNGHLDINSVVELVGGGAASTAVEASPGDDGLVHDSVIWITGGQVTVRGFTIRNGNAQAGGGLYVQAGTVEIRDALIAGNQATTGGAGMYVLPAASVTVRRTTFDGNRAVGAFGGAIWNQGTLQVLESLISNNEANRAGGISNSASTASLVLINTTVSGNKVSRTSSAGVGGILNVGFAVLNNVTVTRNKGVGKDPNANQGGGIQSTAAATTVVQNSIIAGNDGSFGPNDCAGTLSPDSAYDLIGDPAGCTLPPAEQPPSPATFILSQDPRLGDLADNGGPTLTHLPAPDSPAIDAGSPATPGGPAANACAAIDQRGVPRQLICDMGAVEREVAIPTELVVNTTDDLPDARPGDGNCATERNGNVCSLRAAIQEANRLPGNQTIIVPAGIYTLTIPPGDEEGPTPDAGGDLDLLDSVVITGADRASVIIDGNVLSRIFDVAPNTKAVLRQMTIRNGNDAGGGGVRVSTAQLTVDNLIIEGNLSSFDGGGIEVRGVDEVLNVRNSIIRNNHAQSISGNGGGISADGKIALSRTTISGNEASASGGGLFASGEADVVQSTISGNKASGAGGLAVGGGIDATGLNLVQSTVSGNSAAGQGGGIFGDGTIVNSTISGNSSATSGGGVSTSGKLSLLHVTVAANKAMAGGNGLFRFGSTAQLSLQNTILADPGGTECIGIAPTSKGSNIASDRSCALTAAGDKPATDALLDPLADNGGPTRTHRPRDGSPAIDAAVNAGVTVDQRGVPRPQGPRPDIGSVERRR
jgi:CSLREA domain-containing protein